MMTDKEALSFLAARWGVTVQQLQTLCQLCQEAGVSVDVLLKTYYRDWQEKHVWFGQYTLLHALEALVIDLVAQVAADLLKWGYPRARWTTDNTVRFTVPAEMIQAMQQYKQHKVIRMLLKYSTTHSDTPANQETAT